MEAFIQTNQPIRARAYCDEDGLYVQVDWIEGDDNCLGVQTLSDTGDGEPLFAEDECILSVRRAAEGHLVADFIMGFEEPNERWTIPFVIDSLDDWPEEWIS